MGICNLDHFAESYWDPRRHVLVSGCFDPLHEGHLALFEEARRLGPVVCALAPQAEIARRKVPCLPDLTRLKVLNACALIEHVHLATAGTAAVIRALKPIAYVVGHEYLTNLPSDSVDACREVGAAIVFVDCRENSSSGLLADYERRRNAERLAAFEMWTSSQKPADKPWQPVTDYSWEARKAIEKPHAQIIKEAFQPREVLDVGCGPGHLVRLLNAIGVPAHGADRQQQDLECDRWSWWCDICDEQPIDEWSLPYFHYDLVICREVLEHLTARQLAVAVRNLVKLSTRYVYVTTRFAAKSHLLDFDTSDTLDPTHITMLNQDFVRALFVLEGCTRRADLEARLDWQKKGRCLVYEVQR